MFRSKRRRSPGPFDTDMNSRFQLRSKNVCYALLLTVLVILFVTHLLPSSQRPSIPPLPGTYLYYHDIEYRTPNHKLFGAVNHADARFAPSSDPNHGLSIQETKDSLRWLLESYIVKMMELKAETWIAHGTLLGWWWGQHLLPWDTDLDVQMSYATLHRLAQEHNGTRFSTQVMDPEGESMLTREYLLDVNPHYSLITKGDVANHIDARWIDVKNGKYLDITAIHVADEVDKAGNRVELEQRLWCKDGHSYPENYIYPLESSTLDAMAVKVPRDVENILVEEYGRKSITNKRHHWHKFDDKIKQWVPE